MTMNKRDISARLFPTPVKQFELINYSARFKRERSEFFAGVPVHRGRMALHEQIAGLCPDAPITYLEFGVFKGETFRKWLTLSAHEDSRFYGFDSFEGLPEDWEPDQPKGTFSTGGAAPQLTDPRGQFVVGLFQETLYPFLEGRAFAGQMVVHIDCDLYSSTLFVLANLDRHLTPGTLIVFDDFSSLQHEFAAWLDYRRSFGRTWRPIGLTENGWQAAVRLEA
jgi:hypothetical protein